jgi:aldehyde dehydrogenase (NAD+)
MAYSGPTKLFIDNKWVDSVSGKTFSTYNPATAQEIAKISEGDKADVDIAVKVARKAFQSWRNADPSQRCKILWAFAELLEKNKEEFARVESIDNGKPISAALHGDVAGSIAVFRYYAGWADKLQGKTIPVDGDFFSMTVHEPVGVVGQIIPWNFPLMMFSWKVAPALACGNTIVLKPAEQTPLTALMAAELFVQAGLPAGVLNIIPGYGPTAGAAISEHLDVDKIAFTGSTDIGRIILAAAGKSNLKDVTLELGGKSPLIILEDADLDQAVDVADFGLFLNMGQCCCASSRIFVHEKIYDEFVKKAVEKAKKRIVGDPLDPKTEQGPQVDEEQFHKIQGYIKKGQEEGAKLATGGHRFGDKGWFLEPTVFTDVKDDMTIAKEEIFGPVMSVLKFNDLDEVLRRANHTNFGLAAGVVGKDITKCLTAARNMRAGTVWVNCYNIITPNAPFGGFKESGIGRELGEYGLRQYTSVKTITIALPKHKAPIEHI